MIAGTITIPLYGRLGDRIGRKRVLLGAISLFAMGSIACGLADSMPLLSVSRVLQGLGGGGLMVTSQALIGELVPPRERPRFQGYFAANFTLASLAGPIVGGYVVVHASWRWLFLVNIPLMALALWRVGRLPSHRGQGAVAGQPTDVLGAVIFAAAAAITLVWVTFAGHRFPWFSTQSGLLITGAALLWALLARTERRAVSPFLPIELMRDRGIAWMAATVVLFASCFFATVFFLPIYLQLGAGVAASHSGLLLLPLTLGMVTGSTTTGRIVAKNRAADADATYRLDAVSLHAAAARCAGSCAVDHRSLRIRLWDGIRHGDADSTAHHPDACRPPTTWRCCRHRLTVAQPWCCLGNSGLRRARIRFAKKH